VTGADFKSVDHESGRGSIPPSQREFFFCFLADVKKNSLLTAIHVAYSLLQGGPYYFEQISVTKPKFSDPSSFTIVVIFTVFSLKSSSPR
jgi:hypothetical protein